MRLLRLAVLVFAAGPASASAAEVVILKSSDVVAWQPVLDVLRAGIAAHTVTEHDLRGDRAEADRVVSSLKGRDVIAVAMGPLAAQAVQETAPELRLVFCMVPDPDRLGLSGPRIAGVASTIPVKNQLAAFRMVNPRAVRIGVVYNQQNVGPQVEEAAKSVSVLRLILVERPVASEREVGDVLRDLLKGQNAVDALWLPPDPLLLGDETRRLILKETGKTSRPVYAFSSSLVEEGALVSNEPDHSSIGEQVAELVNRLAAGEDPSRMEMLIPQAQLAINKKVADKLGVEIPQTALQEARRRGKVIE